MINVPPVLWRRYTVGFMLWMKSNTFNTQNDSLYQGWGTFFLLSKAITIFRTSLENYIKLLNVYHINLSNVKAGIALAETGMSDGSGDSAINSGFLEFKMLNSPQWSVQNFSPFSPAEGFNAVIHNTWRREKRQKCSTPVCYKYVRTQVQHMRLIKVRIENRNGREEDRDREGWTGVGRTRVDISSNHGNSESQCQKSLNTVLYPEFTSILIFLSI